jgi:hypothetical protein
MKVAAIWARVSTAGQKDLSLDGQVERTKAKLESMGYDPQYVFRAIWTSTDLKPCPEFQELRRLIHTKQIQAVGMLDRDRIEAYGLQRLNFLADCKSNGVEPIVHQGVPFLEGAEGQLVELALALAKEKQVERASSGAKQGLEDRALGRGKFKRAMPTTNRKAFGYTWVGDKDDGKYVPDNNYDNVRLIWELALSGMRLEAISKELFSRGIATLRGSLFWQSTTLRKILQNPIYAGRVAVLKYERVEPKKRKKTTFGKSSSRFKPMEKWHFLDGLVEQSIVSWEQFLAVQERFKLNRQYASRNAHYYFLLRGLIQCQECYAQGLDRHYYGLGKDKVYICSAKVNKTFGGRCKAKPIPCQKIEDDIKARVRSFLENPDVWVKEANNRLDNDIVADIEQQIKDNEKQYQKTILYEREAFMKLTPEAFEQQQALLKAKRVWLKQENERLQAKLNNLKKYNLEKDRVEQMQHCLQINLDRATNEDWRFILEALGVKVLAFGDGCWDIEVNVPVTEANEMRDPILNKTP